MKPVSKVWMVALCLGAGAVGMSTPVLAGSDADTAPPPARDERPAPRTGYVWAAGYWDWTGHGYSWVDGRYIFERRGAHWVPHRWEQVGSRWQRVAGHWEH
jgi:hypothetical protein